MTLVLPPYAEWLGVTMDRTDAGALLFGLPFRPLVVGRPGYLHGGAIAGLLEIAAIGTLLDAVAGEPVPPRIKPVTVTTDFMRGARDQTTYAAATVTRMGNRVANVEAVGWQEARDRPVAAARLTLMLYRD